MAITDAFAALKLYVNSGCGAALDLGLGAKPPATCRLDPHCETDCSRIRMSVNFTASHFDRFCSQHL